MTHLPRSEVLEPDDSGGGSQAGWIDYTIRHALYHPTANCRDCKAVYVCGDTLSE